MLRARSSYRTARQSDRATRWPHHAWRLVDADRARQTPNLQRQANNSCASIEDYRRTREPSIAVKDQAWSSCEHPVFFCFFDRGTAHIDKDKIEKPDFWTVRARVTVVKPGSVTDHYFRHVSACLRSSQDSSHCNFFWRSSLFLAQDTFQTWHPTSWGTSGGRHGSGLHLFLRLHFKCRPPHRFRLRLVAALQGHLAEWL
jgi:hypothetical protein